MCPNEIKGRLKAFSVTQKVVLENYDILAWMIGSYVAHGHHDPKHYPRKPEMIKKEVKIKVMDEESIKETLTTFATIHNSIEEGKNGSNA